MNTKILIGVIVLILILGGLFFWKKERAEAPTLSEISTETGNENTMSGMKSLRDLIGLGTAQKCTFTTDAQGVKSEGIVYVSAGKVRGDFTTTGGTQGVNSASHMISDGKEMRMWQDGQTTGFVMTVPEHKDDTTPPSPAGSPAASTPNYDQAAEYHCESWNRDNSVFEVPQGITFRSMNDMMPPPINAGAQGSSMDLKVMQCKACAQAPNAQAQAQCKAALQCE